jgi:hypothetical protein
MEKERILSVLEEYMSSFKSLPQYIQDDNFNVYMFICDNHSSIKAYNIVNRHSIWHPQALFEFKNQGLYQSVRQYFEMNGDSADNIIGIKTMSVLDVKKNKYINL